MAALLLTSGGLVNAETALVAVASNFAEPLREIAANFAAESGHELRISVGASGHLYAQVINGAPFDIFLSADSQRPALLEQASLIKPGTRFTYAIGTLVFWARTDSGQVASCEAALIDPGRRKLAIANPALAPYGAAAKQVLMRRSLWDGLQGNIVVGQNISQALHFAFSGNADMAYLARSQLRAFAGAVAGCTVEIQGTEHDAILQQGVLLARGSGNAAAEAFIHYLQGANARAVIQEYGYRLSAAAGQETS